MQKVSHRCESTLLTYIVNGRWRLLASFLVDLVLFWTWPKAAQTFPHANVNLNAFKESFFPADDVWDAWVAWDVSERFVIKLLDTFGLSTYLLLHTFCRTHRHRVTEKLLKVCLSATGASVAQFRPVYSNNNC